MTLLWILLTSIALAVGLSIVLRYGRLRRELSKSAQGLTTNYLPVLSSLALGSSSVAADQLMRLLRLDGKQAEGFLVLGKLLRDSAEFERAIRVHQSLLFRRDVSAEVKIRAHLGLARDFEAAGYPDRAQRALEWVVVHDEGSVEALRELVLQYCRYGVWERAAMTQKKLDRLTNAKIKTTQARLWALCAEESLQSGQVEKTRQALRRASAADANSPHVLSVIGNFRMHLKQPAAAIRAWRKAVTVAPDLLPHLGTSLESAYRATQRLSQWQLLIDELSQKYPDHGGVWLVRIRCAEKNAHNNSLKSAIDLATSWSKEQPQNIVAACEIARLRLLEDDSVGLRRALLGLTTLISAQQHEYVCRSCSYRSADHFWCCPKCCTFL